MSTSPRRAGTAASLLVLLALIAGGCRDGADRATAPAPTSSSPSTTTAAKPVRTRTTVGTVTGRLAKQDRRRVVSAAGRVVDRWFDAAYVGGSNPHRRFDNAFPGFTAGARTRAHGDRALLTDRNLDRRITATASRRQVQVDVLAVRGRAVGMTARFALDLARSGKLERELQVRGRLFLTRTERGWKVFGYDVGVGDQPHGKQPPKKPAQKSAQKSGKKGGGR
jgi:hypothetical protein